MILAWMVFAALVSALAAAGAWALEGAGRLARMPVRFVWLAALVGSVALAGLGPARAPVVTAPTPAPGGDEATAAASTLPALEAPAPRPGPAAVVSAARRALTWPVGMAAQASGVAGGWLGRLLGGVWAGLVVVMLGLGALTLRRYRAARRGWPERTVGGVAVRVSPSVGPAVLGLARPEIVVPSWLMARAPAEQRMVVLHEREHVRARDGWVLAAGWLAVAAVPWNPVAWWMLERLRVAVELDCDARVLRHDVGPGAYGRMLIDLAARGPGLSLGVPALAGPRVTLERRILAMTRDSSVTTSRFRIAALGALGAITFLAACEARMPTEADIEEMDATTAEASARDLRLIASDPDSVTWVLDGEEVSAAEARAVAPERLASVEVEKSADGGVIYLVTREGAAAAAPTAAEGGREGRLVGVTEDSMRGFRGLVLVDGVTVPAARLNAIDPADIVSVEILKGTRAAESSDDPRARHGIIRITTRDGAGEP